MSRLRWSLVGVIAVIALVAIWQALFTYARHDLTVGVLAVVALAITLVVGIVSLAHARLRIGRELAGLEAQPARGELHGKTLARLEALRAAGVQPHPEALAESSAAEEAGRAYFGRYLVATTVLIGLVGTFAGLMATLGKVEPLLTETGGGALALLAAPLGGLHVTFGASLVAILVTLALALAQGDLAVHEELALARLRDVTIHDLIPRLWPAADSPADRTVRALDELKISLGDALARSLEKSLETALERSTSRLAAQSRGESERAAKALEAAAGTVEKQITRLCETITGNLAEASRKQSEALTLNASKQSDVLAKAAASTVESLGKTAAAQAQQLEALRAEVQGGLTRAATEHGQVLSSASAALLDKIAAANTAVLDSLRAELSGAVAAVSETTQSVVRESLAASQDAIARAVTAGEESSRRSAQAAQEAASATVQLAKDVVSGTQRSLADAGAALSGAAEASVKAAQGSAAASGDAVRELTTLTREALQAALAAATQAAQESARASSKAAEDAASGVTRALQEVTTAAAGAAEGATSASQKAIEQATAAGVAALAGSAKAIEDATAASRAASEAAAMASREASQAAATASREASQAAVAASAQAIERAVEASTSAAQTAAKESVAAAEAAGQRAVSAGQEAVTALAEHLGKIVEPVFAASAGRLEAVHEVLFEMAARLEGAQNGLTEATAAVGAQGASHVSALEETGKNVLSAFERAVVGGGAALDAAAKVLSEAARDLRSGTESVTPTLRQLGGELSALGREVALMAARGQEGESSMVIFSELERLGAGVDRLTALIDLGRGASADVANDGEAVMAGAPEATSPAPTQGESSAPDAADDVPAVHATGEFPPVEAQTEAALDDEPPAARDAAAADAAETAAEGVLGDPVTTAANLDVTGADPASFAQTEASATETSARTTGKGRKGRKARKVTVEIPAVSEGGLDAATTDAEAVGVEDPALAATGTDGAPDDEAQSFAPPHDGDNNDRTSHVSDDDIDVVTTGASPDRDEGVSVDDDDDAMAVKASAADDHAEGDAAGDVHREDGIDETRRNEDTEV